MYARVLLPLDGTPVSEQALPAAKMLAARLNSVVYLLYVIKPARDLIRGVRPGLTADARIESSRGQARAYLAYWRGALGSSGLAVECEIVVGDPATAIREFAARMQIDLIVMTTHGRSALSRWMRGSIVDDVLSKGNLPLLLVRDHPNITRLSQPQKRILVPLDGSPFAETALAPARQLATAFGAEILLFSVWEALSYRLGSNPDTDLEKMMQQAHERAKHYLIEMTHSLQAQGLCTRWQLQSGLVSASIIRAAHSNGANLIVMSTHGLTGFRRWVEGSITDAVLHGSRVPLLVIKTADQEPASAASRSNRSLMTKEFGQ